MKIIINQGVMTADHFILWKQWQLEHYEERLQECRNKIKTAAWAEGIRLHEEEIFLRRQVENLKK